MSSRRSAAGAVRLAAMAGVLSLIVLQGAHAYRSATTGWAMGTGPRFILNGRDPYANYTQTPVRPAAAEAAPAQSAHAVTDRDPYAVHLQPARYCAVLGDANGSLEHTRACVRLNRAQAQVDIIRVGQEYFQDTRLYRPGIRYYEALKADFPDTWWTHANIATLAGRLGEHELERRERGRADALRAGP